MLGVRCNGAQRLGRGLEQNGIHDLLVLKRHRRHRRRQREDDMKVLHWQQIGLPRRQPGCTGMTLALWAMAVATTIVGAADQPAIGADLGVAPKCGGSAQFDGTHDPPFDAVQVAVMGAPKSLPMAAKDVRNLQVDRHDRRRSRRRHDLNRQPIKRAIGLPDQTARDMGIARRTG